jgi:prophage regulatory protein
MAKQDRFLRLPEVCSTTGLGRTSIYKLVREGKFPRQIRLTARAAGWSESAVNTWMADRMEQSTASTSAA